MGILDRFRSGGGHSSEDGCPYCGTALTGWECWKCDVEFVSEDGRLVERGLSRQGERPEQRCAGCDSSMKGAEATAPWEDGDNADGYVTCPNCGFQNYM